MMMDDRPGVRDEPTVAREDAGAATSDDELEFEFPSVSRDNNDEGCGAAAPADELFAGGHVRAAFYPVFGRVFSDAALPEREQPPRAPLGRLFRLEKARTSSVASTSSSSTSASDLDAASPDSYCLWTPGSSAASSPSRPPPRKSGSTGSVARWRRIGELVVGRSQSDGREKFHFFSAPPSPARDQHASSTPKAKKQPAKGSKAAGADTVAAARRMSYSYGGANGPRRTFLPYRQDLVGLFASVHRGHHHPF